MALVPKWHRFLIQVPSSRNNTENPNVCASGRAHPMASPLLHPIAKQCDLKNQRRCQCHPARMRLTKWNLCAHTSAHLMATLLLHHTARQWSPRCGRQPYLHWGQVVDLCYSKWGEYHSDRPEILTCKLFKWQQYLQNRALSRQLSHWTLNTNWFPSLQV
jgi:hypothetical protein